MRKGIKFRIYPNTRQKQQIAQTLGNCRKVYNEGLTLREEAYKNGSSIGYSATSAMLTKMKKMDKFAYLKESDSIALQQSLRDLDRAYQNFFEKRAGHPVYKSKHAAHQTYRTINQNNNIRIEDGRIKLPKLGWVKVRQTMPADDICNVTVEKTITGKYFVVLNVEFEPEFKPNAGGEIGIDVGIKTFYADSNGNTVENPKYLEKSQRKLAREQRKLSRKKKGSKNRQKQRVRVAKVHEKISNQRNDFLQKVSTALVRENQTICVETLRVKNMVKNHKLARAVSSVSWATFFSMLKYKSLWYGTDLIQIPTLYASSQTCSCCGYKNPEVKNLNIREWDCPVCHTHHDRDKNAAINILHKGMTMTV